jgi:hypothetical protein
LKDEYIKFLKETWGDAMFRDVQQVPAFRVIANPKIKQIHEQIVKER